MRSSFTRRLLAWYARAARDLPWRRTRDPYRVLVSEFMLQQTQVRRVSEFYAGFLARFPDLRTLARANPRAVREAWDGLGYYARAKNLHALAKQVVRRYDATLPQDPEELVTLPGIGRYTAGAVATFAYERAVPAVDTNVARVLRRVFIGEAGGLRPLPPSPHRGEGERVRSKGDSHVWQLAAELVPNDGKRAWKFNQAIMELGALVCVAKNPKCGACPVRLGCSTGRPRGRQRDR